VVLGWYQVVLRGFYGAYKVVLGSF
jgi:hypothetical protein